MGADAVQYYHAVLISRIESRAPLFVIAEAQKTYHQAIDIWVRARISSFQQPV